MGRQAVNSMQVKLIWKRKQRQTVELLPKQSCHDSCFDFNLFTRCTKIFLPFYYPHLLTCSHVIVCTYCPFSFSRAPQSKYQSLSPIPCHFIIVSSMDSFVLTNLILILILPLAVPVLVCYCTCSWLIQWFRTSFLFSTFFTCLPAFPPFGFCIFQTQSLLTNCKAFICALSTKPFSFNMSVWWVCIWVFHLSVLLGDSMNFSVWT